MKIICKHHGPMYRLAKRFGNAHEDIEQLALMSVARSAQLYDPGHEAGASFNTFANGRLKQAASVLIDHGVRDMRNPAEGKKVYSGCSTLKDGKMTLFDNVKASPINDFSDDREEIEKFLRLIDRKSRAIIEKRYGLDGNGGMTLKELGEEMGVSKERVRQIEESAFAKIRRFLKGEDSEDQG